MSSRRYIYNKLKEAGIEENEISAEINFILENCFKILNPYSDIVLSDKQTKQLEEILNQRKKGVPLQYILGIADFMGNKFVVNTSTLIPRPETELLVNKTTILSKNFLTPKILDIGTGTGCIPIMLEKLTTNTKIFASDISHEALKIAKINAKNHKSSITFIHSDLFNNIESKFDIIISNPPYIPLSMKKTIQQEVSFEPSSALYTTDEKGIEFYEKIIKDAKNYLNNNGYLAFEIGIKQSDIVKKIFLDYNYSQIDIIKDLDGIDRVISAKA